MGRRHWGLILCSISLGACSGARPQGLMPAGTGSGPMVMFDLDAEPLPEIPLPSDLATRADPTSPTGKRVNISRYAASAFERKLRKAANRLEGFGTYAPISVRFRAPLDLGNIIERQRNNKDFGDDAVLLVNLQPGPGFGELEPLDFGHGNFPLTVADLNRYWTNDTRSHVPNLLFDTTAEDKNHNGILDPGEDTDGDGYLDVPNVYPEGADPRDGILAFYEKVTDTLIFRPVFPLAQEALYAVVLTKHLVGTDGQPIRSPFPYVNHIRQTEVLRDLPQALAMNGFRMSDVAFVWAFTTQGPTRDLEALRRGLYGVGPFARLNQEFPANVRMLKMVNEGDSPYLLPTEKLLDLVNVILPLTVGGSNEAGAKLLIDSLHNIDYFAMGRYPSPNLMADKDGIATPGYPSDDDESWEIDRKTGHARYVPEEVGFWCAVPRQDRGQGSPFPVAIYNHGHSLSKFTMLAYAGILARYGIASCSITAYGHGVAVPLELRGLVNDAFDAFGIRPTIDEMIPDRARDLDNDGDPDSGADMFSADLFHTRDMLRQTVLDELAFVRVLRSFDGRRTIKQDLNGDGQAELAGDFNGDGIVDLGGPRVDYSVWGHSLGGVISAIVAGIEPVMTAAVPVCLVAGLSDVGMRTASFGVPDTLLLRTMGPIYVGEPGPEPGQVQVSSIVPTLMTSKKLHLLTTDAIAPGDRVVVENLSNGEHFEAYADAERRFRAPVAASALDATRKRALLELPITPPGEAPPVAPDTRALGDLIAIRVYDGSTGALKATLDKFGADVAFEGVTYPAGASLVALTGGMGLSRNTPRFRRLTGNLAQLIIDPGDPINYAPHYFLDPLPSSDYDPAEPGTNVLLIPNAGDPGASVANGIAAARAAGLIDVFNIDPRYGKTVNEVLIDNYIIEGLADLRRFNGEVVLMDPEDFSHGLWAPEAPRLDPPLRLTIDTGRGLQGLRIPLLDPRGEHCPIAPNPDATFDNTTFIVHMLGRYLKTRGREIRDDLCMADQSCDWIPPPSPPRMRSRH